MRGVDTDNVAEPCHVPDAHPAAVDEVHDLGGLPEPEEIGCQHPVARSQRDDVVLPAQFGGGPEFATVQ